MGRLLTTAALLASLALSSCSDDGEATTPTPTPSPTSTSPSADPTPTPPAMPDAARAHTPEGAEAFVRYFWEVVDYASQSFETRAIESLTDDDCIGCSGAIQFVRSMSQGNAKFTGGQTSISNLSPVWVTPGNTRRMQVVFDATTPEQTVDYPGAKRDEIYPAGTSRIRFFLRSTDDGWRVALWENA